MYYELTYIRSYYPGSMIKSVPKHTHANTRPYKAQVCYFSIVFIRSDKIVPPTPPRKNTIDNSEIPPDLSLAAQKRLGIVNKQGLTNVSYFTCFICIDVEIFL